MKKTIAIFTGFTSPHLGGVERFTDKISQKLVANGYRVIVVTSNSHDLNSNETIEGVTYYRLPSKNIFKQRYPILDKTAVYHGLLQKLEAEKIDFIICNTRFYLTTLLGLKIAKQKNVPSIVVEHGGGYVTVGNNIKGYQVIDLMAHCYEHFLSMVVKRRTHRFYAVSKRSTEWLKTFGINAEGVIYNSVDSGLYDQFKERCYLPELKDKTIITFAGRVIEEKGVVLLLEAFKSLTVSKDVYLVIAGDGPILDQLREKYNDPNIYFTGKLDFENTMSLMNQTAIFVNPSIYAEGMPTAVLEAGMLKCAVVATDRGGVKEVINNDSFGIIVEDKIDSIAAALKKLVMDSSLRTEIQENIHNRIKHQFTWDVTVSELIDKVIEKNN